MISQHLTNAYGSTNVTYADDVPEGYYDDESDPYSGFGAQFGYYTDKETGLIL